MSKSKIWLALVILITHLLSIVVGLEEIQAKNELSSSRKGKKRGREPVPIIVKAASKNSKTRRKGPEDSVARKRGKRPAEPLPIDLATISLKDLVDTRPDTLTSARGQQYKDNFANHPDVMNINLYDPVPSNTAQALVALRRNGDRNWQLKMTASIRQYIKGAPFEKEKDRETLLKLVDGTKYNTMRTARQREYRQRVGKDKLDAQRLALDSKCKEETGVCLRTKQRRLKALTLKNKPLSFPLGEGADKLTAMQVEGKIQHLGQYYTSEQALTSEFKRYLASRDTPIEDVTAATAWRASRMRSAKIERQNAKRRKKADDFLHEAARATPYSSNSITLAVASHPASGSRDGQSGTSLSPEQHHSPSPPVPPNFWSHVDPDDSDEWRWFHEFVGP